MFPLRRLVLLLLLLPLVAAALACSSMPGDDDDIEATTTPVRTYSLSVDPDAPCSGVKPEVAQDQIPSDFVRADRQLYAAGDEIPAVEGLADSLPRTATEDLWVCNPEPGLYMYLDATNTRVTYIRYEPGERENLAAALRAEYGDDLPIDLADDAEVVCAAPDSETQGCQAPAIELDDPDDIKALFEGLTALHDALTPADPNANQPLEPGPITDDLVRVLLNDAVNHGDSFQARNQGGACADTPSQHATACLFFSSHAFAETQHFQVQLNLDGALLPSSATVGLDGAVYWSTGQIWKALARDVNLPSTSCSGTASRVYACIGIPAGRELAGEDSSFYQLFEHGRIDYLGGCIVEVRRLDAGVLTLVARYTDLCEPFL